MIQRPPRYTRTDTLFPYTTLFRSEAALLGQAYTFPVPEVVGVRLVGRITAPALTTDAALLITQRLRQENVIGCMVEFFGPAIDDLAVDRKSTRLNSSH